MTSNDLDSLKAEHHRLGEWLIANTLKVGSSEFRRKNLAHRLLTDLINRDGGSPEERRRVVEELTAIHEGKRDGKTAGKPGIGPPPKRK